MHLVYDDGAGERDVEVIATEPDLAVAELAVALGCPSGGALRVEGRTVEAGAAIAGAGFYEGATVTPAPARAGARRPPSRPARGDPAEPDARPDRPVLAVTGGLDAGPSWPLASDATVVGRDPACDVVLRHPTVSSVHCRIDLRGDGAVAVSDLDSHNGTWRCDDALGRHVAVEPGDVLRLGALAAAVRVPPDDRAPSLDRGAPDGLAGTFHFNRPPRPGPPPPAATLRSPTVDAARGPAAPFSLVSFVAPLGLAGVMVWMLGDVRFALFALLSPVVVLGNWVEGRRRNRKQARRARKKLGKAVARFLAVLAEARAAETARRRATLVDPAEALRRAEAPSVRLWERRPHHDDFLHLVAGTGDLRWEPPLDEAGERPPEVERALEEGRLRDVPVPVDPRDGPVGLVGDRTAALAVARSLLCQAATHAGPADLRVAVLTTPAGRADWDLVKWLPHAVEPVSGRRLVIADRRQAEDFLRTRLTAGREGPTWLLAIDDEELISGRGAPARSVLARGTGEAGGGVAGLVLAADGASLPASCRAVVDLHDDLGDGHMVRPQQGEVVESFLATGVGRATARRWARLLARFDDPEVDIPGAGLPSAVHLSSILETDPFDAEAVAARWRTNRGRAPLAAAIGAGDGGVVRLDLDTVGPHGLVAGTTGSGKSELLRTVVASLALELGPDEVTFLLVDYKGGAAFDACASLPHVVGLVTDLDDRLAVLALRAVEGEVRRRERLLRAAGSADLRAYRRARGRGAPLPPLPRLVVVVDELATLATELPKFLDALLDVAQRGRALGLHLLLATQRPRGVVGANIRTNTNLRIALRVQDASDSLDVIDSEAAAGIPPDLRGRAYLRAGPGDLRAVQAALVTGTAPTESPALTVLPFGGDNGSAANGTGDEARAPDDHEPSDLARVVAAVRAAFESEEQQPPPALWTDDERGEVAIPSVGLFDLLGMTDAAAVDRHETWRPRPRRDHLRVPIGVDDDGQPVTLDLKESAFDGMGPHGLVVGATGSGKSELLRTLVLALATTHPPEALSLVLVDFKGGATFAGTARLPHVAGVITNLADDLALVDRMRDAMYGEQRRRQELLKQAGNLASVDDYNRRRAAGERLAPLPSLLVVVDEFAELLASKPDFIDLFSTIGRLGRSLGIHLLLASQRLDEGRLRGLESSLRYRIGLRTFSPADSRAVLGADDAYTLPAEPGGGYLKVDADVLQRFKAAWVSAPASGDPLGPTVLDVAVGRLEDSGRRVHQVWLPPLDTAIPLDRIPQPTDAGGAAPLSVAVGEQDRPEDQAKVPLVLNLAGGEGNVAVVGATQSGKSTLLRTLVAAFALTHTPLEVQFYCVDCGGGSLLALDRLPHVGTVASRLDAERVRRLVVEIEGVLAFREELFRSAGIDSAHGLRARRAAGALDDSPLGDVFLVIDGWARFRQEFEELEPVVLDLASRGLGYGVHVVVTGNRWPEIRSNLLDNLGTRLELRLHDPVDSAIDRRAAANIEADTPGRGLSRGALHFQAALPRVDGIASAIDAAAGLEHLVARVADAWTGPAAPPVRLLPNRLAFTDLPAPGAGRGVPIGVAEDDLGPAHLDLLGADPHFVVFGDGESGKTNLLRLFLTGLIASQGPEHARIVVVDYRRTLLDAVPPGHLVGYAGAGPAAADLVSRVADVLASRLPPADLSARQLRDRSWWTGGEVYVVVDDYDLVTSPTGNPLLPLVEFVALGRDLGFHLVLTRRVAGAARAGFEPLMARLHEMGTPGLILSGDRQEGPVLGAHRASEQPPGRGLLVHRRRPPVLVQTAETPALLAV
jgi:S-DNA-T family DNA segregation ATPase FtsK/SpoIIIE